MSRSPTNAFPCRTDQNTRSPSSGTPTSRAPADVVHGVRGIGGELCGKSTPGVRTLREDEADAEQSQGRQRALRGLRHRRADSSQLQPGGAVPTGVPGTRGGTDLKTLRNPAHVMVSPIPSRTHRTTTGSLTRVIRIAMKMLAASRPLRHPRAVTSPRYMRRVLQSSGPRRPEPRAPSPRLGACQWR